MKPQINISLNEFQIQPPDSVWNGISLKLDTIEATEKHIQALHMFEIGLEDLWAAISKKLDEEMPQFTTPIMPIATGAKNKAEILKLGSIKKFLGAVAAMLVLFLSFYGIYQYKRSSKDIVTVNTNPSQQPKPAIDTSVIAKSDTGLSQNKLLITQATEARKLFVYKKHDAGKKKVHEEPVVVEFNVFDIEDEDSFFLVLANYVLPQAKSNKKLSIKVDKYSTIYFSSKMTLFMQGLYQRTGRKNRPTSLARRSYRKLRQWKRACAKHFGSKKMNNLSDPFVLSEFLDDNQ